MRLRYELTRWDLVRSGMRALVLQRLHWLFSLALFAACWWYMFHFAEGLGVWGTATSALVATLLALAGAAFGMLVGFLFLAAQAFLRTDRGVLGEHTLEVTDEGLVESTDVNRSVHTWGASLRVREAGAYAFVFVAEGNAHVVPLRRAPLEGSVTEFLDELRARIGLAQQDGGPGTR